MDMVVECDTRVILIRDGAGLILAPRRHVKRWRDLDGDEQSALMARITPAQTVLETDGVTASVALIESGPHFYFRLDVPASVTGPIPGAPHDRPLISGGDDALHAHLRPLIDQAQRGDLAVSFLMTSGARLVLPHLRDLLDRGGRLRLLTGDYLDVTEPTALRLMQDLDHDRHLYIFRAARIPFHPKAWMFSFADGAGAMIVGASNLSRAALTNGVEWNLRHGACEPC